MHLLITDPVNIGKRLLLLVPLPVSLGRGGGAVVENRPLRAAQYPFGYLIFKSGFLTRVLGIYLMISCYGGPGFATILRVYPEDNLGLVVMGNDTAINRAVLADMEW